jgi:hypothetical protein
MKNRFCLNLKDTRWQDTKKLLIFAGSYLPKNGLSKPFFDSGKNGNFQKALDILLKK